VLTPAVLLFVAFIRLIPAGDGEQFVSRTQDSFYAFVNLATIFLPLAAVLLALLLRPQHPKARVITVVALVEYGVAAFFGVVFGILIGLVQVGRFSVRTAFEELLVRAAWLAVFALAAVAVHRVWRGLFHVPRPAPQPGVYGQPQYGVPGTYPGQPGYGPPPGAFGGQPPSGQSQPGQPPSGQSQPGQPPSGQPQPGQPPSGQPQPGQPSWSQPAFGQPPYGQGQPPAPQGAQWGQPPVSVQPTPVQPAPVQPAPAWPASAQPAPARPVPAQPAPPGPYPPGQAPPAHGAPAATPSSGAFSDPTQAVPRHDQTTIDPGPYPGGRGDDRTEVVRDDRLGHGPAGEDPHRR
jgi:hypothetical protein